MLVCSYGHSKFGVSGDLVSHSDNFAVNMARNDVLIAECHLWKKIPAFLKPFAEKKVKTTLTDQDRIYLVGQMLKGEVNYSDVCTKRLFKNSDGKFFTLKQVFKHADGCVTIAPSRWKQVRGTELHRRKIAFCFSYDFADTFGFASLQEFFSALIASPMVIADHPIDMSRIDVVDFEKAASTVSDRNDIIPESDLTPLDRARLRAVDAMYRQMMECFFLSETRSGRCTESDRGRAFKKASRNISVGKSEVFKAWTDGERYIAVNINLLRSAFNSGFNGLTNLVTILLHEQCHDGVSSVSHSHDDNFYERFHDVITDDGTSIFSIAAKGLEAYLSQNKKLKRSMSEKEVKNFFRTLERLFKLAQ